MAGKENIWLQFEQFARIIPLELDVAAGPPIVNVEIATLLPAMVLKSTTEGHDALLAFRVILREPDKNADAPDAFVLLRPRCSGNASVTPPSAIINCRRPIVMAIASHRFDMAKNTTPQNGGLWPS